LETGANAGLDAASDATAGAGTGAGTGTGAGAGAGTTWACGGCSVTAGCTASPDEQAVAKASKTAPTAIILQPTATILSCSG